VGGGSRIRILEFDIPLIANTNVPTMQHSPMDEPLPPPPPQVHCGPETTPAQALQRSLDSVLADLEVIERQFRPSRRDRRRPPVGGPTIHGSTLRVIIEGGWHVDELRGNDFELIERHFRSLRRRLSVYAVGG